MKYKSLTMFAFVVGSASLTAGLNCGMPAPTADTKTRLSEIANNPYFLLSGTSEIPVTFHVIRDDNGSGGISDANIRTQVNVLNSEMSRFGVDFFLHSIKRYDSSSDTVHSPPTSTDQTVPLRADYTQSSEFILNVIVVNSITGGVAGYAVFPGDWEEGSHQNAIVMDKDFMPGGSGTNFNSGKILAHEVGHYFGLFHTFQDGCDETNDQVDDTPAHQQSPANPPVNSDTCPDLPGFDPINNHMNYTQDSLRLEFTAGQEARSRAIVPEEFPTLIQDYIFSGYNVDTSNGDNWRNVPWFNWVNDEDFPWIQSIEHGWMYTTSTSETDVWLWAQGSLGWIHTDKTTYPWLYRSLDGAWLFYQEGSGDIYNPTSLRWFYNDSTDQWFTESISTGFTPPT